MGVELDAGLGPELGVGLGSGLSARLGLGLDAGLAAAPNQGIQTRSSLNKGYKYKEFLEKLAQKSFSINQLQFH